MALVRCADCGKDRSDQAPACPHCGRPTPSGYSAPADDVPIRAVGFVLLSAIVGLAFMAMVGRSSPSISPTDAAMLGPSDADLQVSAQMAVQAQLRDLGSAQFLNGVVVRQDSSTAVCGEVNAKSGFGGYIGYTSFVAIGSLVQLQTKHDDGFPTLWNAACVRPNGKGEVAAP